MYHRVGSTAPSNPRRVARRMTEDEHHVEAARTPSPPGDPDEEPTGDRDAAPDTDDRTAPDERTDAADAAHGVEAAPAVDAEATSACGAVPELACDGGETGVSNGETETGTDDGETETGTDDGETETGTDDGETGTGTDDGETDGGDDTLPDLVADRMQDRFGLSAQRWFVVESFLLVVPYPVFVFVYLSFPVPEAPFFGVTAVYSLFALWFGYRREVPDVDDDAK